MKILRLANVPAIYFDFNRYIKENPDLSCDELVEKSIKMGGLVPANFTPSMKLLGWESVDFLIDECFIEKWCKENKTKFQGYKTIKKVIAFHRPDIIYIERCSWALPAEEFRHEVKKEFPFIKAVILWIGVPPSGSIKNYLGFDIIFNITPKMVQEYSPACQRTFCVRSALDLIPDQVAQPHNLPEKKHLFTFLGSSGHGMWEHSERFESLVFLLKNSPLKAWVNEPLSFSKRELHNEQFYQKWFSLSYEKLLKSLNMKKYREVKDFGLRFLTGEPFESIMNDCKIHPPLKYLYGKNIYSAAYGDMYHQILSESQITLNLHLDFPGHGGNFRVFEAAKNSTCLLTDRAEHMHDLLDVEKDIVGFTSPQEALDKFNYLKDKPELCSRLGKNLKNKFLARHTIYHRCQEMIGHISKFLEEDC
ncbi:MAG: hypothetical protein S4CHLAM6_10490 [Chlamydiae bacterium]|nr:hypothetical protein [Chlamydiota bacterium]